MKKLKVISLLILTILFTNSYAQVDRQLVVFQETTVDFSKSITCWWQHSVGDPFETSKSKVTFLMYDFNGAFYTEEIGIEIDSLYPRGKDRDYPGFWCDGEKVSEITGIYLDPTPDYDKRIATKSNFTVNISETHTDANYEASIEIVKEADFTTTDLILKLVLKETNIYYEWSSWDGTTELDHINNVVRDIIPNIIGTTVDISTLNADGKITIKEKFTIDSKWDKDNCELVAYIFDGETKEILQANKVSLAGSEFKNDASIFSILEPSGSICEAKIKPSIILKNKGTDALQSLTITYGIEGGTMNTYDWTGNVAFADRKKFTLPEYTFTDDYNKTKKLLVTCSLPNGVADENTTNDKASVSFKQAKFKTNSLNFEISTETYGTGGFSDNHWKLFDDSGDVVAEGKEYTLEAKKEETIELTKGGCYTFLMYDDYGDGISGAGSYFLTDEAGKIVARNGEFTKEESSSFYIDYVAGVEKENEEPTISIYPNPNKGEFNISGVINSTITIYNQIGMIVYSKYCTDNEEYINIDALPSSCYFVNVINQNGVVSKKTIVIN